MAASFAQPFSGIVEPENQEVLVLGWDIHYADSPRDEDVVTLFTLDEVGRIRLRDKSEVRFRMVLDPETQEWIDDPIPGSVPSA